MFRIGMFSKITLVTIKTLRYYDEIDLLKPSYTDSENNYRYYTYEQLPILHKIISLKQCGFSIDEIKSIMSGHNIDFIIDQRKKELESEFKNISSQLSRINDLLKESEDKLNMDYKVVIKDLPECIVFSSRQTIPNYSDYNTVIPSIGEKVGKKYPNLKCMDPDYCFVCYHDGEYKESNIDMEYFQAVTEMKDDFDGIKFQKLEKTKAATIMHKGGYEKLGNAYAYIIKWLKDNGHEIKATPRETYINGIWNTDNINEWVTEIQIPIE